MPSNKVEPAGDDADDESEFETSDSEYYNTASETVSEAAYNAPFDTVLKANGTTGDAEAGGEDEDEDEDEEDEPKRCLCCKVCCFKCKKGGKKVRRRIRRFWRQCWPLRKLRKAWR